MCQRVRPGLLIPQRAVPNSLERNATTGAANESQGLEELQRLHERLIACSRDCIKILDLEGRLLFVNEGGAKSLEICDLDSVLHEFWIEFWQGEDRAAASTALDTAHRNPRTIRVATVHRIGRTVNGYHSRRLAKKVGGAQGCANISMRFG